MEGAIKQDLPPSGGYKRIIFHRIPPKKYFSGYTMFAGYIGLTAFSSYFVWLDLKRQRRLKVENCDVKVALEPLLLAERDRMYLKQLRKNREEEAELMKDVPGWKVGTYYGEPLYKTISKDTFMDPIRNEYYAHANKLYLWESAYISALY
ncbi:NADH dehydrogenase [ubiquinone] 1 alpha subcomplex subunit 13 [Centruroides vittatus]|uniref:NADH dehydrogenase [ubiquinone] 1 alpha subcomplex subunit 13 n=1 Tax=Centruroides vittatus TaxID=120091 RepID=UPI00350F8BF2